ncbi:GNAT family N-acetyltransferase [Aureliella helgolandensis]|uniref:Ribosomal-protein-alanine N-acetyltransferase n=1 Tax=Aureliella helgolandensis TaxID=2527968 RepID=A0A518GD72_9BACT|nr:GNAT family N-acetyltransferase [Aureliella helgolandensis]QDV26554.1 ribosomal-protein-alanine N-acetyltransferase [Aureliella helgolandensis]
MAVTYFKRYRMELRLDQIPASALESAGLPDGFRLLGWSPKLLEHHAQVKWASFREEIDAHVFPCLADREGCRALMGEITRRKNFVPQATWLVSRENEFSDDIQPCGTIQGLLSASHEGAIQNIGVHPECRDMGLGRTLLAAALEGFREANCRFVNLEVTVQNVAAIRLYERFGFQRVETLFKIAEVQMA